MATESHAYSLSRGAHYGFKGCGVTAIPSWFSTTFPKIVLEAMPSEMPQLCKLLLGVSKGMLPVKHLAPKIIMAVNYCWRQLARRLGWGHLPTIKMKVPPCILEYAYSLSHQYYYHNNINIKILVLREV